MFYHDQPDIEEEELFQERLNSYEDSEFEILVQAYLHDVKYTSRTQAIWNIVYAVLNAGIVALPFAASKGGLLIYCVSIFIICLISGYTTCMGINLAYEQKVRTLEDLGEIAFGAAGLYIISIWQIILSISLMCVTLSVWSDVVSRILQSRLQLSSQNSLSYLIHPRTAVLIGSFLIFPLCILTRTMNSLRFASWLTVLAIIASISAVVALFAAEVPTNPSTQVIFPSATRIFDLSYIIPFCFSFNQKAFIVYSCLKRRDPQRWQHSVIRALLIVSAIYIIFGSFGFLSFISFGNEDSKFNYFLENDVPKDISLFFDCMSALVAFSLLLTMPVDCLVAVTTFRRLLRYFYKNRSFVNKSSRTLPYLSFSPLEYMNNTFNGNTGAHDYANIQEKEDDDVNENTLDRQLKTNGTIYDRVDPSDEEIVLMDTEDEVLQTNAHASTVTETPSNSQTSQSQERDSDVSFVSNWDFDFTNDNHNHSKAMGHSSPQGKGAYVQSYMSVTNIKAKGLGSPSPGFNYSRESLESAARLGIGSQRDSKASETVIFFHDISSSQDLDIVYKTSEHGLAHAHAYGQSNARRSSSRDSDRDRDRQQDEQEGEQGECHRNSKYRDVVFETGDNDESLLRQTRQSSMGWSVSMHNRASLRGGDATSIYRCLCGSLPGFVFWLISLIICTTIDQRLNLAISLGSLGTIVLVYIVPAMLYFRIGLSLDYSVIPVCGLFIPNRLYMSVILAIGIVLLFGNLVIVGYFAATGSSPYDEQGDEK